MISVIYICVCLDSFFFFFLHGDVHLFQHHLLKRYSIVLPWLICHKDWLSKLTWVYFWALYSVAWTSLSVLLLIPNSPAYHSFIVSLEVVLHWSSNFIFLLQYYVGYSESFASLCKL